MPYFNVLPIYYLTMCKILKNIIFLVDSIINIRVWIFFMSKKLCPDTHKYLITEFFNKMPHNERFFLNVTKINQDLLI